MPIVVVGMSHRTSRVEVREKFALDESGIASTLEALKQNGLADEAVILSTCNRVELYAVCQMPETEASKAMRQFLFDSKVASPPLDNEIYVLKEPQSLEHLFRVAAGLDSMVLGETEILGQLKTAYDLALKHKHTGRILNKAFQRAFNVAKQLRTHTGIQRGSISVGSVAVELAEKIFSSLEHRRVMVVGAGDTSEKTARSLLSRGASSVIVANRTYERAEALAAELGGTAVRFEDWATEFQSIDIAISSTSAPHYILDRAKLAPIMKLRHNRPLLLIDIAVPRDIDPEVSYLENVYLYNIDDLQTIADDYLKQRQEEITRCDHIIREKARGLQENLIRFGVSPLTGLAFEHE